MNIVKALVHNASRVSEKTAVVYENRSYTYREFNCIVNRFANGLLESGVKKGEKVALMMKNSDYFALSYFACVKIGAIVVPINFRLVDREVAYILNQSDSSVVISDPEFEKMIFAVKQNLPHIRQVITAESTSHPKNVAIDDLLSTKITEPAVEINSTDDVHILYTSGTTGNPKGAIFDHQLVIVLLSSFYVGGFNLIHSEFNPQDVYRDIEKHKITHFFAIPMMYRLMLAYKEKNQYDVSSISCFSYGAAPMSASEIKKYMDFFQSTNFYSLCGLTEGGPTGIYLSPEGHLKKAGVSGKHAIL